MSLFQVQLGRMRLYELTMVLNPSITEKQKTSFLDGIKKSLGDKVKIVKEEDWGQKPLAYKIKKQVAGIYHMLQFESDTGVKASFEKGLMREEEVLRHLLIRRK